MARCPSCDDALTATIHEGVSLNLCNDCGGTWATAADLEALMGGPVGIAKSRGTTTHRCASCMTTMKKARLDDRVEVELCLACGGVFFSPGALLRFAPVRSQQLVASPNASRGGFRCVGCREHFPIEQGTVSLGGGLRCRPCAGLGESAAGKAGDVAVQSTVDWLVAHQAVVITIVSRSNASPPAGASVPRTR